MDCLTACFLNQFGINYRENSLTIFWPLWGAGGSDPICGIPPNLRDLFQDLNGNIICNRYLKMQMEHLLCWSSWIASLISHPNFSSNCPNGLPDGLLSRPVWNRLQGNSLTIFWPLWGAGGSDPICEILPNLRDLFQDLNGNIICNRYPLDRILWCKSWSWESTLVGLSTDPAPLIIANFFKFRVLWS